MLAGALEAPQIPILFLLFVPLSVCGDGAAAAFFSSPEAEAQRERERPYSHAYSSTSSRAQEAADQRERERERREKRRRSSAVGNSIDFFELFFFFLSSRLFLVGLR